MAMHDSLRYHEKLCLIKHELDINELIILKTWLFNIRDLHISTAKNVGIIKVKH